MAWLTRSLLLLWASSTMGFTQEVPWLLAPKAFPLHQESNDTADATPDGVDNPGLHEPNIFFDPDDITTRPWYSLPIDLELHGRFDLTWFHFESDQNLDGSDEDFFNTFNPALNIYWTLDERFSLRTEIEFEGDEGRFELDQLILRTELPEIAGSADLGITYVPFGLERFFYSSTTIPSSIAPPPSAVSSQAPTLTWERFCAENTSWTPVGE